MRPRFFTQIPPAFPQLARRASEQACVAENRNTAPSSASARAAAVLLWAAALAIGCGKTDPRVGVSGSVTLGGTPLDQGIVEFHGAATEGPAGGAAIVAGRYEVPRSHGLLPGDYRVVVLSAGEQISGPGIADPFATDPPSGKDSLPGLIRFRDRIPPEFGSESNLKTTLLAGQDNTFDIAIPAAAGRRP